MASRIFNMDSEKTVKYKISSKIQGTWRNRNILVGIKNIKI